MKGMRLALAIAAVLATAGVAAADDAGDIKKLAQEVLDGFNAGDAARIAQHFAGDIPYFSGNGRTLMIFNKDHYQALFDAGLDYDLEWRDLAVKVYGNSAVSNAYLYGTVRRPDSTVTQTPFRSTVTWVKEGGKWKVVQFHTSELKPDVQGAQELISRYHKAIADRDLKTARACLGDSYVRAFRQAGVPDDPKRWTGGYGKAADIDEWLGTFTPAEVKYENAIEFLHADLTEESGVVVTRETGSFTSPQQSGSWEGVVNMWWVTRIGEDWKIVGSIHHLQ